MIRALRDDQDLCYSIRLRRVGPAEDGVFSDIVDGPEMGEGGVAEAAGYVEGREDVAEGDGVGGGVGEGDGQLGGRDDLASGGDFDGSGDVEGE